jgi:hypothetical protein
MGFVRKPNTLEGSESDPGRDAQWKKESRPLVHPPILTGEDHDPRTIISKKVGATLTGHTYGCRSAFDKKVPLGKRELRVIAKTNELRNGQNREQHPTVKNTAKKG